MTNQLRILHLEDNPADADLVNHNLLKSDLPCIITQVDNGKAFEQALQRPDYDLILSDYSLPSYDGSKALEYVKANCPNIPFIFVTGEMGEERAIESLKQGAIDYVMKDRMGKLIPAIERALAEAGQVRKQREAEKQLRLITDIAPTYIARIDTEQRFTFVNRPYAAQFGLTVDELIGKHVRDIIGEMRYALTAVLLEQALEGRQVIADVEFPMENGGPRTMHYRFVPELDEQGKVSAAVVNILDVTEQKRAEREAMHERERAGEILEHVQEGFYAVDRDWVFTYVNRRALEMWNKPAEEILGKPFEEVFSQFSSTGSYEPLHRVMEHRTPLRFETFSALLHQWVEVSAYPANAGGLTVYFRDITERKHAEEALRRSEEKFSKAFYGNAAGMTITRLRDGLYLEVNDEWCRLMGYDREEVLGNTSLGLHIWKYPEDRTRFVHELERQGRVQNQDYPFLRKNGEEWTGLVSSETGEIGGEEVLFSSMMDITENKRNEERLRQTLAERKTAEQSLRQSEKQFEEMIDGAPLAIYLKDLEGHFLVINKDLEQWLGISREAIRGKTDYDIYPKDRADEFRQQDLEVIRSGKPARMEIGSELPDGSKQYSIVNKFLLFDIDGKSYAICGIATDITDRRRAEQELSESEVRFRTMADNIPQLAWMADEKGWIFWYNRQWYDYTGTTFEEMQGWGWQKVHHPDYLGKVTAEWQTKINTGQPYDNIFPLRGKDGAYRWFLTRVTPIKDEQGIIRRWFGTNTDITEQIDTQERIRQLNEELERRVKERTEELTATNRELETFSYAVSHDLRAPLRSISAFSELLIEDASDKLGSEDLRHLSLIRDSAARLGKLVQEILNFSRLNRQEVSRSSLDMRALTEEILKKQQEAHRGCSITVSLDSLPPVYADRTLINQVMENLISNAVKFSSQKEHPGITIGGYRTPDEVVYFVEDNGAGFDMAYYDKLFGFFQRLHSADEFEGTGVGLAFSYRIIQRHGGKMWAEGEVDKGATFYFSLPAERK